MISDVIRAYPTIITIAIMHTAFMKENLLCLLSIYTRKLNVLRDFIIIPVNNIVLL